MSFSEVFMTAELSTGTLTQLISFLALFNLDIMKQLC